MDSPTADTQRTLSVAESSRILRVLQYYMDVIKSVQCMNERIACATQVYEFLLQTVPYPVSADSGIAVWLSANMETLREYVDDVEIPLSKKIRLHTALRHVEQMFQGKESVIEAAHILVRMKQEA